MATAATQLERVEDADFQQVANPTNVIILPDDATKGEKVAHLANTIPANDYGLPLYYLRSDMLDWSKIEAHGYLTHDEVNNAAEILSYDGGYPTLRRGTAFWAQLPHEPHQSYLLFQSFLELAEDEGIRLLDSLASKEAIPLENVRELSLEYFWSSRARAYDLFIVAAEAKKREARTRKTEDHHFKTAQSILDTIVNRINSEPKLIQEMEATDLFDLFEKMVKVQRLSLGLTGANASTNNQLPMGPGQTVEVILRQLTKEVGLTDSAGQNFQQKLKLLMGDPETAMKAQELVIRATTSNEVHQNG